jgi:diphthamide synthase (EF-2-diphthine--ammonia ligase)
MLLVINKKGSVTAMTTNTNTQTLSTLVEERIRLKAELDNVTQRLKDLDEVVIAELQSQNLTKFETTVGKVNLVQSNTVVWNDEVLKELLKPVQWKRIIVEKVDKSRLDAELAVGRIDESLVDVARSIKQSKPFLR